MNRFGDADKPPENLTPWLAAGMRRVEALAWRRWHFTLEDAVRWRKAGVPGALAAAQWQIVGVNPDTVGGWVDAGIDGPSAIRWREFGFTLQQAADHVKNGRDPDQVYNQGRSGAVGTGSNPMGDRWREFINSGVPHQVVGSYIQVQWVDDEALTWAKASIPAWDARMWQDIGLVAEEAAELIKADITPVRVMRDWWRAGIPFDEVANWLGAGLTAAEAVKQRKSGVTVEQAAALRALRRGNPT